MKALEYIEGVLDVLDELLECEREGCTIEQAVLVVREKKKLGQVGQDGQKLLGDHF